MNERCTYDLDTGYRIVGVGDSWNRFAIENAAPHLSAPAVLGRSVLAEISDATTAHLYERLFLRVAMTGDPVVVPIRCDAPALRRFLDLEIQRLPGGYRVTTTTRRTEPRDEIRLLDISAPRTGAWIRMCGWCKDVQVGTSWASTEAAVLTLRLFESDTLPQVTHGMCPRCYASMDTLLGTVNVTPPTR